MPTFHRFILDGCAICFFVSNSLDAGCISASTASAQLLVLPFQVRDLTLHEFDLLAQRDLDRERAHSAHSTIARKGIMAMPISSTMASNSHVITRSLSISGLSFKPRDHLFEQDDDILSIPRRC